MRPRVLLVPPHYGWAFHNIARQLSRHLSSRFDFTIKTLQELTAAERYDLTVTLLWTQAERVRWRIGEETRSIACLYDHASTSTDTGRQLFQRTALNSTAWIVGSPALVGIAQELVARAVALCQDGVDLDLFKPLPPPQAFTVGWCGNVAIGDGTYKGLELIREACKRAGVPLVVQAFEEKIPHEEMPTKFYGRISAYVCASLAEGTPNPVFEALSCGRPVITTRVGLTEQVVQHGVNGLFVERSVEAITAAIRDLRSWPDRSAVCRAAVEPHDWNVAAERWGNALEAALAAPQHDRCCNAAL